MLSYVSIGRGISTRNFSCCRRLSVEVTMQVRFVFLRPWFVKEKCRLCFFGCSLDAFFRVLYDSSNHGGTPGYARSFRKMFSDAEGFRLKKCVGKIHFGMCVVWHVGQCLRVILLCVSCDAF